MSAAAAPLSLIKSAELLGRWHFMEMELYRRTGTLASLASTGVAEDPLRLFVAGASMAHAWRAREIESLLPVSAGLPAPAELLSGDLRLALEAAATRSIGDSHGLPGAVAALVGSVYPTIAHAYERRAATGSPVCDPAVRRVMRRLVADLQAVLEDGSAVLASHGAGAGAMRHPSADELASLIEPDRST